jgi:hypothetical protein
MNLTPSPISTTSTRARPVQRPGRVLVMPEAHASSINNVLKYVRKRFFLFFVAFAFTAMNAAIIAVFADHDHYNFSQYTYWNFLEVVVLCVGIMIGLVVQGYVEGLFALIYAPVAIGSALLVPLIVSLVIFLDPDVYLNGTICAGGSMPMNYVRTGDWILHGLPPLQVLVLLLCGYLYYERTILFHFNRSRHWFWAFLYAVFFIFCPAIPMGIYAAFNNIAKQYPVPWKSWQIVLASLAMDIVVMVTMYIIFVQNTDEQRVLIQFYSRESLRPKKTASAAASSRGRPVVSPSPSRKLFPQNFV